MNGDSMERVTAIRYVATGVGTSVKGSTRRVLANITGNTVDRNTPSP